MNGLAWRVAGARNEARLQYLVHGLFRDERAVLLSQNASARRLAGWIRATLREVQFQDQTGGHESARALDPRRERGRGEYLHATDSSTGPPAAKPQNCGFDHDVDRNG